MVLSTSLQILKLKHHIHSSSRNIIQRTVQYFKDRNKSFDDYFLVEEEEEEKMQIISCNKLVEYVC
jgi:hypothetical protein